MGPYLVSFQLSLAFKQSSLMNDDNMFSGQLPEWLSSFRILTVLMPDLSSFANLQELDLEDNTFGPRFPPLGNKLVRLVLGKNKFQSGIPSELSSYYQFEWLDLSFNRFVGPFPPSLFIIKPFDWKLAKLSLGFQGPSFPLRSKLPGNPLAMAITGGIVGGIVVLSLVFIFVWRYLLQTMNLGALGLPAYRTFSLEELEVATNNFDTAAFMGEGSQGQMYRVRALGHCFECYLDDSSVSRIFLIFEYVPNGTLKSWISVCRGPWRTLAYMGTTHIGCDRIAKGFEFLHTWFVPGVYPNHMKITDVLMDQNFVAKISSYSLPLLAENADRVGHGTSCPPKDPSTRASYDDKSNVHDFGVILLEMILGRPSKSRNQVQILKNQLEAIMATDDATRRLIAYPTVRTSCSDQSLKTRMEICVRCLVKDPAGRPSVEDVLWNLQFAAQVQVAWKVDSRSSEGSPGSPLELPHLRVAFH
ncbi:putative inactive leucine-rich repeat receptor-like protein kinase [Hibiscus syriacus]|uniref:Inactive leucine-rich repeat receptor-like protein kinase n=1 Tax=Hibiscus syriacus TaxID=106335 RepID=A0A6A2WKC8_HIBSY|nr:putative inactive leucine-rich repeat receptor-like protein kinase [Hibiscus syriacus]